MAKWHRAFGTTADVGVNSSGDSMKEAFEAQAAGMFSLMTDLRRVRSVDEFTVEAGGADAGGLLVAWLNELLYLYETKRVFLRTFEIKTLTGRKLKAVVYGERIDPARHLKKTEVKAVTYHMLEAGETEDGFATRVVYDI